MVIIAKSRRPATPLRSHEPSSACTWAGSRKRGSPARRLATDGTAAASGTASRPSTWQNLRNDRNADTARWAVFGVRAPLTVSTKPTTSAADTPARSTPAFLARASTNGRTRST